MDPQNPAAAQIIPAATVPDQVFSGSEAIGFGWKNLGKFFWYSALFSGYGIIVSLLKNPLQAQFSFAGSLIFYLLCYAAMPVIGIGTVTLLLKVVSGENTRFSDIFSKSGLYFKYLITQMITTAMFFGGALFLLLPGVILGLELSQAEYLVVDQGLGPIEAIRRSSVITRGQKKKLLWFAFLRFGVIVLGLLAIILGLLAAVPVIQIASVYVYTKLNSGFSASKNYSASPGYSVGFFKYFCAVIGFLLMAAFFTFWIYPQLYVVPMYRIALTKITNPMVYVAPQTRIITPPVSDLSLLPDISYFGMTFKSPWMETSTSGPYRNIVSFTYSQGQKILFTRNSFYPAAKMKKDTSPNFQRIRAELGQHTLDSEYNFYSAAINSTPDQVSYKSDIKTIAGKAILTVLKAGQIVSPYDGDKTLYSFQTDSIRGFQFGSPAISHHVWIHFFNPDDQAYDLIASGSALTQNDVDLMLSTMKKAQE